MTLEHRLGRVSRAGSRSPWPWRRAARTRSGGPLERDRGGCSPLLRPEPAQRRAVEDALGREDRGCGVARRARRRTRGGASAGRRSRAYPRHGGAPGGPSSRYARPGSRQLHAARRAGARRGLPAAFGALDPEAAVDRLAFARWLVSPENPLTARVAVNRLWARLFGRGLVPPRRGTSAPRGLDARPTRSCSTGWPSSSASGWDQRALLRTIVSSEAYRQASARRPRAGARPRWDVALRATRASGWRRRWSGTSTLRAAGLLSSKRFGPSVFPPQPDGLWQAAFNGQRNWQESISRTATGAGSTCSCAGRSRTPCSRPSTRRAARRARSSASRRTRRCRPS